jgi:hypothetical protein
MSEPRWPEVRPACGDDPLDLLESLRRSTGVGESVAVVPPRPPDGTPESARWRAFVAQAGRAGFDVDPASPGPGALRLRRAAAAGRWRVGRVDEHCAPQARALFERVFGHPMDEALWRWKYGEGRGAAIGVWHAERLVAHYGGLTREVLMRGRPILASQSCDVMVDPSERGTLSRQGPLFLAAATYLEREVGDGARHLLGYGFPNERAWRLPHRLGLYGGPAGRVVELSWRPRPAAPSWRYAVRRLDLSLAAGREAADACWRAMAADLADVVLGVRDQRWLEHRFLRHPAARYELYAVRERLGGRARAVFVLRALGGGAELLDVVARPRDVRLAVEAARRVAARRELPALHAWVTENAARWFGDGASVTDPHVAVPTCAWTPGPALSEVAGRWWLTGGDTDFR